MEKLTNGGHHAEAPYLPKDGSTPPPPQEGNYFNNKIFFNSWRFGLSF